MNMSFAVLLPIMSSVFSDIPRTNLSPIVYIDGKFYSRQDPKFLEQSSDILKGSIDVDLCFCGLSTYVQEGDWIINPEMTKMIQAKDYHCTLIEMSKYLDETTQELNPSNLSIDFIFKSFKKVIISSVEGFNTNENGSISNYDIIKKGTDSILNLKNISDNSTLQSVFNYSISCLNSNSEEKEDSTEINAARPDDIPEITNFEDFKKQTAVVFGRLLDAVGIEDTKHLQNCKDHLEEFINFIRPTC